MSGTSHLNKVFHCLMCDEVFARDGLTRGRKSYCGPCTGKKVVLQMAAYKAVRQAVSSGALPKPWTQKCVDCQKDARIYDHRNYATPLDVEPVCGTCNQRRGPASWSKTPPSQNPHRPPHPARLSPTAQSPTSPQRVGMRREVV